MAFPVNTKACNEAFMTTKGLVLHCIFFFKFYLSVAGKKMLPVLQITNGGKLMQCPELLETYWKHL